MSMKTESDNHILRSFKVGPWLVEPALNRVSRDGITNQLEIKVMDVKANQMIWDGSIIGYRKYETDYRTGASKKFKSDEIMLSDIRKDLVARVVEKLYPKPK